MINLLISIISFVIFFNILLLYLDDFKLSHNKYIRLCQIITPFLFVILIVLSYYFLIDIFDCIYINDNGNN